MLAPDVLKDQATAFVARVQERVSMTSWSRDVAGCGARLHSTLALLQRRLGVDDALPLAGPGLLTPRELGREVAESVREMWRAPPSEGLGLKQRANDWVQRHRGGAVGLARR